MKRLISLISGIRAACENNVFGLDSSPITTQVVDIDASV